MFTGIITNLGKVEEARNNNNKDVLIVISCCKKSQTQTRIGSSIAISGICLTLISKKLLKQKFIFFSIIKETSPKNYNF